MRQKSATQAGGVGSLEYSIGGTLHVWNRNIQECKLRTDLGRPDMDCLDAQRGWHFNEGHDEIGINQEYPQQSRRTLSRSPANNHFNSFVACRRDKLPILASVIFRAATLRILKGSLTLLEIKPLNFIFFWVLKCYNHVMFPISQISHLGNNGQRHRPDFHSLSSLVYVHILYEICHHISKLHPTAFLWRQ